MSRVRIPPPRPIDIQGFRRKAETFFSALFCVDTEGKGPKLKVVDSRVRLHLRCIQDGEAWKRDNMLRFMAGGQWLVVVPDLQVAEGLGTGILIFASRRALFACSGGGNAHAYPNGVPELARFVAFSGLHERHVFGLTISKYLSAIARCLIASLVIRSGSGQA